MLTRPNFRLDIPRETYEHVNQKRLTFNFNEKPDPAS